MRRQQGLSLIELMISITIGLILMTGVVQLFISSKSTFYTQQAVSRIQETGRLAVNFMARDIRMAGYMGCSSRATGENTLINGLDVNESSPGHLYNFKVGMQGYTAANHPLGSDVEVKANTDVLVVRHAGGNALGIIQPVNNGGTNNANIQVNGNSNNNCVQGICKEDIAIISDCVKSYIFRVTGVTGSNPAKIVHSKKGNPKNKDTKLGGNSFGPGAKILKVSTITYYIAEGASGQPSLWQSSGGNTYELLTGVQDMHLTYGVADGGGLVDEYKLAEDVSDWAKVRAVRMELLVRSLQDNAVPQAQTYTFAGTAVTPSDRYMRQVFTSTVAIRNRLP